MARRTCTLTPGCSRPETLGGGCIRCKFDGGVRVNGIALFRHDRNLGVTQMQKAREIFDGVRENQTRKGGRNQGTKDIQRVRGGRTATERQRNGKWERA